MIKKVRNEDDYLFVYIEWDRSVIFITSLILQNYEDFSSIIAAKSSSLHNTVLGVGEIMDQDHSIQHWKKHNDKANIKNRLLL